MADVVAPEVRSRMMSLISGRDTKPERIVRRGLWVMGLRFRLHGRDLPGRPDLVLPKWCAVVFVNGCFWHAHADCRYFKIPPSRPEFWKSKLAANRQRDATAISQLQAENWNVITVWECALRQESEAALLATADLIRKGHCGNWHVEIHTNLPRGRQLAISQR